MSDKLGEMLGDLLGGNLETEFLINLLPEILRNPFGFYLISIIFIIGACIVVVLIKSGEQSGKG